MEDKGEISPSGVAVKGDEAPDSYRLAPRAETQQNPNPSPFPGPTVVVAPPPPPTTVTPPPAASSATPPSISGTVSDFMKKRRGRPRKYGPDGTPNPRASAPTLSPMPISSSIPLARDNSNWKRGKPRPIESVKKSHKFEFESPGHGLSYFVGANFTTHVFTVNAGEDVTMKVMSFSQQGSRAICILSANGTISNVTLRQPTTSGGTLTYEGRFEILSLSGSFMPMENGETKGRSGGMSISLAGPDGRVVGGGLAGLLVAAGPVQVIMGSFIVGHQAEHKQKKPRISDPVDASAPPPPPAFTITAVNAKISAVDEQKSQAFTGGSGGVIKPMAIPTPSTFPISNNPLVQGFGNLNVGLNNEEDSPSHGDESRDTPSQSNCELSS